MVELFIYFEKLNKHLNKYCMYLEVLTYLFDGITRI